MSGITFLRALITAFEPIRTKVAAIPIPIALEAAVVTAKVGQVPRIRHRTGFSLTIPFVSSLT